MKTSNLRRTGKDFYLLYPYKYRDIESKTIPVPYFNKSEITDHRFTVTYKEWKLITNTYFSILQDYLLSGLPYKLPHGLGEIQFKKYKGGGIDHKKTKEFYGDLAYKDKRIIRFKNVHTDGYRPVIKWNRKTAKLANKWLWRFNLLQNRWKLISKKINKNLNTINNFNTI